MAGDPSPALNVRRVEEQSHKDEMAAALRADFERLRARRSTQAVGSDESPRPEPVRPPEPADGRVSILARLLGR